MTESPPLACPLDGLPLVQDGRQVRCSKNHSYDIARQGYINLLPVQFKKSRDPGDSQSMVLARTDFLDAGFYQPVADKLLALLLDHSSSINGRVTILDAGCGEGWYTCQLDHGLRQAGVNVQLIGLDISKPAIQAAARRSRQLVWLVATNSRPPVLASSLDVVFSIFGYPYLNTLLPLLKPGGILISVTPGPQHLIQLRQQIYQQVDADDVGDEVADSESLLKSETLQFDIEQLAPEHVSNLLQMTPHFFKVRPALREQLACQMLARCSIDMRFSIYQRTGIS